MLGLIYIISFYSHNNPRSPVVFKNMYYTNEETETQRSQEAYPRYTARGGRVVIETEAIWLPDNKMSQIVLVSECQSVPEQCK